MKYSFGVLTFKCIDFLDIDGRLEVVSLFIKITRPTFVRNTNHEN